MAKTVEVDEATLLAQQQISALVDVISKNPAARKLFHQAVKTARPDAVIPEVDAAQPLLDEIAAERKAREALEKKIADKDAAEEAARRTADFQNSWERQKDRLRDEGWMDDGIAEVEKLAQERGIVDLEAAALLHQKLHPPAEPITPNGLGGFDIFQMPAEEDAAMKKLLESKGEDESALRSMVNTALTDVRSGSRRRAA